MSNEVLRNRQEHLHHVNRIYKAWFSILHGDRELMSLTDSTTVKAVQLRVPGLCTEDAEFLERLMKDGVLWSEIKSPEERQRIWSDLCQIKTPIPSIWSYFEDIKILAHYAKIMKQLLGNNIKHTIRRALLDSFSGVNQKEGEVRVQETETSFRSYQGSLTDQKHLGIVQLGQHAIRKFPTLIPKCPRKEDGQDTPVPKPPEASAWQALATLAYNLGFECEEIHRLRSRNPDREIARAALLEARKPERYKYEEKNFESFQGQMADMFATAVELSSDSASPTFFVDNSGESLQRRCGIAFDNAYKSDRECFFLKALAVSDHSGGKGVTSLFVRVSVHLAFFGDLVPSNTCRDATATALRNPLGPPLGSGNLAFPLQPDVQTSNSSMTSEHQFRLEEERDRLRSELTKAADDHRKVSEELVEQKIHMEQMAREAADLHNQVVGQEMLQKEVERLRDDQARATAELDEHKNSAEKNVQELTEEIAALRSQHEFEEKALQSALINNQELSTAFAELEQDLQRLEAAASFDTEKLRTENKELKNANEVFQQSLNQSETTQQIALDIALIEKEKLSAGNEELRKEIEKLSTEKDEFEQNLNRSQATQSDALREFLIEKDRLSASDRDLRQENKKLSIIIDELQQNLERSKATQLDALKESLIEIEKLWASNEELSRQKEELTTMNGKLRKDLERSEKTHDNKMEELLVNTKSGAEALRAEIASLRDNKDATKQHVLEMSENKILQYKINSLNANIELLKRELASSREETASSRKETASLREEHNWLIISSMVDIEVGLAFVLILRRDVADPN
jgi:hypothetical protein